MSEKKLTLWGLVAIVFFTVSGGPFGSESGVKMATPFWCLVGFLIFPFLWSIPAALITAELSSAFPSNTGYVSWVTAAFGPYWGFIQGWLASISCCVNAAIFPQLFWEYLPTTFTQMKSLEFPFVVCFSLLNCYFSYRGIESVGFLGLILLAVVIAPFLALISLALLRHSNSIALLSTGIEILPWKIPDFTGFLNLLFWNLNYLDCTSTLTGEIAGNVSKVMSAGLGIALLLSILMYVCPIAACIIANDPADYTNWEEGDFQKFAYSLGGNALWVLMLISAGGSQIGQMQSQISEIGFQMQAMGEAGWFPSFFGLSSKHGTPWVPLILIFLIVLTLFPVTTLTKIELMNSVYCISQLIEICAFLKLRSGSYFHRPFKIPLGMKGSFLLVTVPVLLLIAVLILPFFEYNKRKLVIFFVIFSVVLGNLLYGLNEYARKSEWFHYKRSPPNNLEEVIAYHKEQLHV
jgi:amino acid transporter